EFILSPLQFGVPNSRPRYYLLACSDWNMMIDGEISTTLESCDPPEPKEISYFLEESPFNKHTYLSRSNLLKYGLAVDVVSVHSTRSACFTKSYGSYIAGCGSYFCSRPDFVDGNRLTAEALADEEVLHDVVRLFSPREVANLMCFPMEFKSPADATDKQLYRCLGNSVNHIFLASLICTRCASTPDCPCVENMSQKSNSGENSEESLAERTVATSVIRDTGTKVQLLFKAHGLKKRKSLLNSIVTAFRKFFTGGGEKGGPSNLLCVQMGTLGI
ncbi:hypothetical protein TELCIR_17176, partial [Teladorsagia circumcincta]